MNEKLETNTIEKIHSIANLYWKLDASSLMQYDYQMVVTNILRKRCKKNKKRLVIVHVLTLI